VATPRELDAFTFAATVPRHWAFRVRRVQLLLDRHGGTGHGGDGIGVRAISALFRAVVIPHAMRIVRRAPPRDPCPGRSRGWRALCSWSLPDVIAGLIVPGQVLPIGVFRFGRRAVFALILFGQKADRPMILSCHELRLAGTPTRAIVNDVPCPWTAAKKLGLIVPNGIGVNPRCCICLARYQKETVALPAFRARRVFSRKRLDRSHRIGPGMGPKIALRRDLSTANELVGRLCGSNNTFSQLSDTARLHGASPQFALRTIVRPVGGLCIAQHAPRGCSLCPSCRAVQRQTNEVADQAIHGEYSSCHRDTGPWADVEPVGLL